MLGFGRFHASTVHQPSIQKRLIVSHLTSQFDCPVHLHKSFRPRNFVYPAPPIVRSALPYIEAMDGKRCTGMRERNLNRSANGKVQLKADGRCNP